ncbi:MAG TPA: HD domain-containing phosphohydrolase [Solirubrobacteraceae bacterium]|jgi:putative two-component system response regulator|nr:HD domain-containing phosphohydrolase [Solirubrobacteraceae bacterium]
MPQLLIVDDDEALRRWEERVARENGYSCDGARDADDARERLRGDSYRLALLDVNMPGDSGIELLSQIRRDHPDVAVVMVTGEDSTELAMSAIELGAYGYLVKPVGSGELLINVANALHRRSSEARNRHVMQRLQAAVQQRDDELAQALQELELAETKVWVSQAETILRLARLMEFRDEETGQHLHRMSSYCELLARQTGLPEERCEFLRLASQLHDVGKVAVPDSILLKPGKLTPEEFEVIKGHAETGYQMLAGSASEVVQLGALIARTHHERWDGSGYPRGLAGEDIPLEGRIAAVSDVFDALTSDRVYRSAMPVKSAMQMMSEERGRHFDPDLLDAFLLTLPEIDAIRHAYAD